MLIIISIEKKEYDEAKMRSNDDDSGSSATE